MNNVTPESAVMAQAFREGGTRAGEALSAQVLEARKLVAKALGDDARDLVFIPITPCTVWDTRFATDPNSSGLIASGQTRKFYSHLDGAGGSFANWGGNPSCPETAEDSIGSRPFAVMMTVYISDATAQGWLTLYRDGDPDPSNATISVYYSPGPTRTQTVISKSSRGYGSGAYDIAATSRFASTNASASVTGYFLKAVNITLVNSTASTGNILKGANRFIHNYGTNNTFIGVNAGNFTMSGNGNNTASGANALLSNTIGSYNAASGANALTSNTIGNYNTAIGADALAGNTTGGYNTATGTSALGSNTTGSYNTASGTGALAFNTGSNNTASGALTLQSNTTGSSNTASGGLALAGNTTGNANTASGTSALQSNTTGVNNTASGVNALASNTTGSSNIALGDGAGSNLTTGNTNIHIGHLGVAAEGNTMRIGSGQTRAFIAGIRGVTTGNSNAVNVLIDSLGQLGTVNSSRRAKQGIADMGEATAALMKLRPVTFHYKAHGDASPVQYGLVAEEVDKVYPGLVAKHPDGSTETVMYHFLPPMLLNEYQKQQRTIEQQARMIEQLETRLARTERQLQITHKGNP